MRQLYVLAKSTSLTFMTQVVGEFDGLKVKSGKFTLAIMGKRPWLPKPLGPNTWPT